MSYMKQFAMEVSEDMGMGGQLTDVVLREAQDRLDGINVELLDKYRRRCGDTIRDCWRYAWRQTRIAPSENLLFIPCGQLAMECLDRRMPVVDPLAEYDVERTRARRGEYCHSCGYPFDTGDRVLLVDEDYPFCSRTCAGEFYS